MKHIKLFEEFSETNEGVIDWAKRLLFKTKFAVNYSAQIDGKDDEKPLSWSSYLTVNAKDADDAEAKFKKKWEDAVKKLDPEPSLIIGTIHAKTKKSDKPNITIPKRDKTKK